MKKHFFSYLCSVELPSNFTLFENLAAEYAYEKEWLFLKICVNYTTLFHNSCWKWEKELRNKQQKIGGKKKPRQ